MLFRHKNNFSIFSKIISIILLFSLSACQTKAQRTRKFVLSKDSIFIGTWHGKLVDAKYKEDTVGATFCFYSKDSNLYMYKDYISKTDDFNIYKMQSDSMILELLMFNGAYYKFTDRKYSLFGMHDFFGNDSVIYIYDDENYGNDPRNQLPKNQYLKEYFIINEDNSLSRVEEDKHSSDHVTTKLIRYTLQPILGKN